MDSRRDVALIVLVLVVAACLSVFFMKVAEPTGAIVDLLLPRL